MQRMQRWGTGMKRVISILCILLAAAILAHSEPVVQLGGSGGTSLLQDLTNNSTTITNSSNITVNLSSAATTMQLEGAGGAGLFENLTNGTSSAGGANNTTDGLNSWGRKLRPLGPPPNYDPEAAKSAEMIDVIRQNHLGY
jgi:hypothetical protein